MFTSCLIRENVFIYTVGKRPTTSLRPLSQAKKKRGLGPQALSLEVWRNASEYSKPVAVYQFRHNYCIRKLLGLSRVFRCSEQSRVESHGKAPITLAPGYRHAPVSLDEGCYE